MKPTPQSVVSLPPQAAGYPEPTAPGRLVGEQVAERMDVSLPNVSQHLALLWDRGAVMTGLDGVNVYCQVTGPRIIPACNIVRDVLFEQLARSGQLVGLVHDGG